MSKFNVALVVGSNRRESINRQLAQAIGQLGRDQFNAKIARIDDLPLYNQDLEAALPESVSRFKAEIEAADGVIIVTPEHSRSIPAVLKSAIDWGARPWGKTSWPGKPIAITGTTPGAIGTAIAQMHLRQVLGAQGTLVMGGESYITYKPDLVAADGTITDESTRNFLKGFVDQFAALLGKLAPRSEARTAA